MEIDTYILNLSDINNNMIEKYDQNMCTLYFNVRILAASNVTCTKKQEHNDTFKENNQ